MIHDTWYMIHDTWYMIHDDNVIITDDDNIYCWTFLIFMLMLMLYLWLQADTHFGAYHRPPDGHFLTFPLFSYGPLPSADTVKLTIRQVKRAEQREARRRKRMESSREPGFQVVCNASMYATLSKININWYNNDNVHPF